MSVLFRGRVCRGSPMLLGGTSTIHISVFRGCLVSTADSPVLLLWGWGWWWVWNRGAVLGVGGVGTLLGPEGSGVLVEGGLAACLWLACFGGVFGVFGRACCSGEPFLVGCGR